MLKVRWLSSIKDKGHTPFWGMAFACFANVKCLFRGARGYRNKGAVLPAFPECHNPIGEGK